MAPGGLGIVGCDPVLVSAQRAKIARRDCTFSHCFSSFESMVSLTILVWIGTQVRRSKPSQMSPLNSALVLTRFTTRADSMRMPHLPCKSMTRYVKIKNTRSSDMENCLQKPGSLVMTCPGTRGMVVLNECGPSWTLRNEPKP